MNVLPLHIKVLFINYYFYQIDLPIGMTYDYEEVTGRKRMYMYLVEIQKKMWMTFGTISQTYKSRPVFCTKESLSFWEHVQDKTLYLKGY
jgi:hypothetical protein